MEDIDDLLDEVESKYVKKKAPSQNTGAGESKVIPHLLSSNKKKSSAIDAAIDDILDLELDDKNQSKTPKQSTSSTKLAPRKEVTATGVTEQARRCLPLFLGGSNDPMGLASAVNQRACDQLRCTSCDFKVCTFDNMAWKKDTDYLFLRNNVPNFDKLKSKLIRKKGWRAYCCQCSWRNILELCELTDSSLKWVCGKHVL